jgi:phage replication O-like protein O
MPQIDKPNFTQIPNIILGDIQRGNIVDSGLMASLEGSQLKVLLAVCRLTFGFHQNTRRASITMIEKLTGLSRQGVINAANKLEELGLIVRSKDGGVTLWQVVVNSVDYLDNQQESTELTRLVNSVDSHLRNKPKKENTTTTRDAAREKITTLYLATANGKATQTGADIINDILDSYPADIIIYACTEAEKNTTPSDDKRNLSYIEAVCKRKVSGQPDKPVYKNGATNGHNTKSYYQNNGAGQPTGESLANEPTVNIYDNE